MGKSNNPFAILGLTAEVLRGLTDTQAKELVDSQYRALARIYHPDMPGGDAGEFREVAEAYADLSHLDEREAARKAYTRPKKGLVASQAAAIHDAVSRGEVLAERLRDFWTASLGIDGTLYARVVDLKGACMTVRRTLRNTVRVRREEKIIFAPQPTGAMCEMEFDDQRAITLYPLKRVRYDSRHVQPPAEIPEHRVHQGGSPWLCSYEERMPGEVLTGVRVVATVSKSLRLQMFPNGGGLAPKDLLTGRVEEKFELVDDGFVWEQLQPLVPFLSPYVRAEDELIGMTTDGPPRFIFMGAVVRMWPL